VSEVFVCGCGAVSPAGWGVAALSDCLTRGEPLLVQDIARPGWTESLRGRVVPPPPERPAFLGHARLRRSSPIAQYAVAAALEALGEDGPQSGKAFDRLGIVLCVMAGCVNYSRRFYGETLHDPATASPLVFPETVFNAPASHLAALLGATAINYTLVGDQGTFLQGIAMAADWLADKRVDGCLVIGAEEMDWLTADAAKLFDEQVIVAEGAGALYLRGGDTSTVRLEAITGAYLFSNGPTRCKAAQLARNELGVSRPASVLCDGVQGVPRLDRAETEAWRDWTGARLSPKMMLGEGFVAGAAWQCVAAADLLRRKRCLAADVSVVGINQQAIAARFAASAAESIAGAGHDR
jgi:hypothetical protein